MCRPSLGYSERVGWRSALGAVSIALAIGTPVTGAFAADTPPNPAEPLPDTAESRAADALFEQLLKDPKNVDLTFRYAEAAVKAGNIEAAISSLERLLLLEKLSEDGMPLEQLRQAVEKGNLVFMPGDQVVGARY